MIDEVFNSALEKKCPLILNHMALGEENDHHCSLPLDFGYKGSLDTVLTRNSDIEPEADGTQVGEPRDPPPSLDHSDLVSTSLKQNTQTQNTQTKKNRQKQKRPLPFLRKKQDSATTTVFEDLLCLPNNLISKNRGQTNAPNGLLAKARGHTASSIVTDMLEASKNENFENHRTSPKITSPTATEMPTSAANKKEQQQHRFVVNLPIYARVQVGRRAKSEKKCDYDYVYDEHEQDHQRRDINSLLPMAAFTKTETNFVDDDSLIAAAASKWRAAKEKYLIRKAKEDTDKRLKETETRIITSTSTTSSITNHEEFARESALPAEYDGLTYDFIATANKKHNLQRSTRIAMDPPEVITGSEIDDEIKKETSDLMPLFRKLSSTLKQMEGKYIAHRSRLLEQKLRHQKRKTNIKEQAVFSSSLTMFSSSTPSMSVEGESALVA